MFRKRNELRDISSVAAGSLMSAVPGAQALRTVALTAGGGAQEPRPPRSPRQRPHSAPGGALGAEPLRGPCAAPRAWHGVLVPRTFGRRACPFARVPGPWVAPAAGGHQGWHRWRCQARGARGWGDAQGRPRAPAQGGREGSMSPAPWQLRGCGPSPDTGKRGAVPTAGRRARLSVLCLPDTTLRWNAP